jgi:phage N-6-adenine-methyltransferase
MAKDNWETPYDFIDNIKQEFPLILDVCTDGKNAKTDLFLCDSLKYDWASIVKINGGGYIWCNPPYSDPTPWANKLVKTVKEGVGSLFLVNAMTSSKWYHIALKHCAELWTFEGRISFIDPDTGKPGKNNDRSQVMFVFDPNKIGQAVNRSVKVSDYQTHRKKYREYLTMCTIVEFDPMTTKRLPTGRYCRLPCTREQLPATLMMMGINVPMDNKGVLGWRLFVYRGEIPVGSDWKETQIHELVKAP